MLKAMIKLLDDPVQSHNAANWSFSTTMRISGSLYISFDTVKSDFLSAKARLPESPVLTNTFTKLPRLAGIFSATFFLRLASIWGLCFVSFRLIYSVNGGLTHAHAEKSFSIWWCSPRIRLKCNNKTGSMDSGVYTDKKGFTFTIDSILNGAFENTERSKIPSLENAYVSTLEAHGEKSAMNHQSVNQMDGRTCMNCCCCSHCGEILHTAASKTPIFNLYLFNVFSLRIKPTTF